MGVYVSPFISISDAAVVVAQNPDVERPHRELCMALRDGELVARGLINGIEDALSVEWWDDPKIDWSQSKIININAPFASVKQPHARWTYLKGALAHEKSLEDPEFEKYYPCCVAYSVRILCKDVQSIWGTDRDLDFCCVPSFPGRKSIMRKVWNEMQRRAQANQTLPTLSSESEVLAAWIMDVAGDEQVPTAKAIQNALRHHYKRLRDEHPK